MENKQDVTQLQDGLFFIPDGPISHALYHDAQARDISDTCVDNRYWYKEADGSHDLYDIGIAAGCGKEIRHTGKSQWWKDFCLTDFDLILYWSVCTLWMCGKHSFGAKDLYSVLPVKVKLDTPEISEAFAKLTCTRVTAPDPCLSGTYQSGHYRTVVQENLLYAKLRLGNGSVIEETGKFRNCSEVAILCEPFLLEEARVAGRVVAVPMRMVREMLEDGLKEDSVRKLLEIMEVM